MTAVPWYPRVTSIISQITEKAAEMLRRIRQQYPQQSAVPLSITGSAGMGMAAGCGIPFIQEVYATRLAANTYLPGTDVIIELGGEDAKILFLTGGTEVRMNGTCAGGTGAFIDQMATLMKLTPDEMNQLATQATQASTIASRCGVFAKSDIQPLLNQGAQKTDVSRSISLRWSTRPLQGWHKAVRFKGMWSIWAGLSRF